MKTKKKRQQQQQQRKNSMLLTNSICHCHKTMAINNEKNSGLSLCHLIDSNDNNNDYHQQQQQQQKQQQNQSLNSMNYYHYKENFFHNNIIVHDKDDNDDDHHQLQHSNLKQQFILSSSSSSFISDDFFRFPSIHRQQQQYSLFFIDFKIAILNNYLTLLNNYSVFYQKFQHSLTNMRPKPFRLIQYQYLLLSLLVVFYCFGLVFSTSSSSSSTLTSITNHQRFQSDNNNISLSTTSVSSLQIDNNNNNNVLSPSSSTIILSNHINTTTTVIPNLMMMFNSSTSDTNVYLSKENVDFGWSQQIENPSIKTSKRNDLSDSIDIDLDGLDPINSDDLTVNIDDDDDDIMVIVDSDDVPKFESSSSPSSNQPIRRQVKSSSEEDFDDDNGQNQQHQQQQQHSFINDNVDYVMHSPRTVQTKYGALQGIVITFVRYNDDDDDSDNEKSTSTSSTSSPSANQNHNNSSSIPTPIITLTPVEAFLGVPYATPPSGNLRFMPPVAPVHWRGVRQANHLSPVCPQSLPFSSMNLSSSTTIDSSELQQKLHISPRHYERLQRQIPFLSNQSEDCLYLNIYVPFEQYYQHRLYQRQRQQQQQQQNRKLKSTSTSSFGNCFFKNCHLVKLVVFN